MPATSVADRNKFAHTRANGANRRSHYRTPRWRLHTHTHSVRKGIAPTFHSLSERRRFVYSINQTKICWKHRAARFMCCMKPQYEHVCDHSIILDRCCEWEWPRTKSAKPKSVSTVILVEVMQYDVNWVDNSHLENHIARVVHPEILGRVSRLAELDGQAML